MNLIVKADTDLDCGYNAYGYTVLFNLKPASHYTSPNFQGTTAFHGLIIVKHRTVKPPST